MGEVEHKHHHILNGARALRFKAHLPYIFGGVCTQCGLFNKPNSHQVLKGVSPYELHIFGVLCFTRNNPRIKHKLLQGVGSACLWATLFAKKGWKFMTWRLKNDSNQGHGL